MVDQPNDSLDHKKIAILQSNYIPWIGYFDIVRNVDEFIILDEVQFTKNDWRNRNRIKTQRGIEWLTIPVRHISLDQKISEVKVVNSDWAAKHFRTLSQAYCKTSHFNELAEWTEALFLEAEKYEYLSDINAFFLRSICEKLGIFTHITSSKKYILEAGRTDRLVSLCKQSGAKTYITGPAAKNYLDESGFTNNGIQVKWMHYSGYREYSQLHPPFTHSVSVLDLIFNTGSSALSCFGETLS